MAYQEITVTTEQRVTTITLNRPDTLNALGEPMAQEVLAALDAAGADPDVRVIVITGAGRGFTSGADLKGNSVGPDGKFSAGDALRRTYNPLMLKIRDVPQPVVAVVNGAAVGVGASLAAACDLIVAADKAYFLMAFVNIGLTVDGGASHSLARRIGFGRSAEMAMLGGRVSAEQAHAWGLVNRVAPVEQLQETAGEVVQKLAAGAPLANRASKALLNATCFDGFAEALEREAAAQQELGHSADFVEGVTAFLGKRAADFSGR